MAQPKHKADSTLATAAAAAAPTHAEFVLGIAAAVAARRDFLKEECVTLHNLMTEGKELLQSLHTHAEQLKVLAAFNQGSDFYAGMLAECSERKTQVMNLLKDYSTMYEHYRGEHNALLQLTSKEAK
jgi:hypothetical protein